LRTKKESNRHDQGGTDKKKKLRKAFLEAKWLYNWLVSDTERLGIPANKVSAVEV